MFVLSFPTLEHVKNVFAEIFGTLFSPLTICVWGSLVAVTWAAGPFGTYSALSAFPRLGFWAAVITIGILGDHLVRAVTMAFIRPQHKTPFELVAVGLAILLFSPVVWHIGIYIARLNDDPRPPFLLALCYVLLIGMVLVIFRRLTPEFRRQAQLDDRVPSRDEAAQPRLMRRVPEALHGQILRLSADGHFVEVVTEHGSHRLRIRFVDAIGETEPQPGHCVHRSHWVTREAIKGVERPTPHKIVIRLINGDEIPVGRKYKPGLEQAGIL
ncbi:LytTR family DNA-binding domain-containing protein [Roseovarius sp. C7]|uniref:LytTR family DNA-binding domain-containing protein n=1 Tax=Roseovarius sp. C7 TaxID=3398643 RepID=UPI0039F6BD69